VLYKVASEAISETSECTTIGELMEKLERQPWDASA
jgi:hypothetical protein